MAITMTAAMRDLLIAHIDGPAKVIRHGRQVMLWQSAFDRGLICSVHPNQRMPKQSRLTIEGRKVLARELACWAEALIRAGYDVKTTPKYKAALQLAA